MKIRIAYACMEGVHVSEHEVAVGSNVLEAIEQSGVLRQFPEIDLARNGVGIYGRLVAPDTPVKEGDRVEIYVPVLLDPKQARRKRAGKGGGGSSV